MKYLTFFTVSCFSYSASCYFAYYLLLWVLQTLTSSHYHQHLKHCQSLFFQSTQTQPALILPFLKPALPLVSLTLSLPHLLLVCFNLQICQVLVPNLPTLLLDQVVSPLRLAFLLHSCLNSNIFLHLLA